MAVYRETSGVWVRDTFRPDEIHNVFYPLYQQGYGYERWFSPDLADYKYGLYRAYGGRTKVPVGVFDSPDELLAMCKLILAS